MRHLTLAALLFIAMSLTAFGQDTDPVGFCPPPATVSACTTGIGIGNETITVGSTSIGMEKNGSGTSDTPWYLLIAIPDGTSAPTVTIAGFTQSGATTNAGDFLPTTSGSLYGFTGTTGDASLNATNLFGANEQQAFGGTPTFFDVFVYTFTPAFGSFVPYTLTVGGSGLPNGTFLAASGGSNPFSTPYTTAGLVDGAVPEPSSMILLAAACGIAVIAFRKKAVAR